MMRENRPMDKLGEFHKAFGHPTNATLESGKELKLRLDLITEEFEEVRKACVDAVFAQGANSGVVPKKNLADITKELCDLLYVTYGFARTFNLPIEAAFNRVHESNMSKLGEDGKPVYRQDGKVLKGSNYWYPDLEGLFE